jgi:hypothetical protein
MFGQSTDWLYSTPSGESTLADQTGKPIGGIATTQVKFYDAGTEAD